VVTVETVKLTKHPPISVSDNVW